MKTKKIVKVLGTLVLFTSVILGGASCKQSPDPEPVKYTVKFNSNGGSEVADKTVVEGEKVQKPENPTKEGFTFENWKNGENVYNFDDPVKSDLTLTASWKENENTNTGDNTGSDAGDSGNTGDAGDTGNTGDSGDSGDAGNTGDSDSTGGDSGNTGDAGNTGNTGDSGDSGDAGNTGDSGSTGDSGDSGDAGNSGDSGSTGGDSGNTGDSGSTEVSYLPITKEFDITNWNDWAEVAVIDFSKVNAPANISKVGVVCEVYDEGGNKIDLSSDWAARVGIQLVDNLTGPYWENDAAAHVLGETDYNGGVADKLVNFVEGAVGIKVQVKQKKVSKVIVKEVIFQ